MSFQDPIWLYLWFPFLLGMSGLLLLSARARKRKLALLVSSRLIDTLAASASPWRRRTKAVLMLLVVASTMLALARPQWGYEWRETRTRGIDVVFAVDVSRSMLAQDIKPDRLERSKFAILDFIQNLRGDRVGLVAFAGSAFLQCPLTVDYHAFRQSVEALSPDVIPVGGTDLAGAITEAEAAFGQNDNYKLIILVTDGEDLEGRGLAVAKKAAERNVIIYTVGVGTPEGGTIPIRDRFGRVDYVRDEGNEIVRTRLDATTLLGIAESTGGFYVPLGASGEGLVQIYEAGIKSIPRQEHDSRLQQIPLERFQWPLGFAVLLLVLECLTGTRRRFSGKATTTLASLMVVALIGASTTVQAEGPPAHRLEEIRQLQQTVANNPDDHRSYYNLGTALYRQGQLNEAIKAFQQSLGSDDPDLHARALHNLGNAYFHRGHRTLAENRDQAREDWEEALRHYRNALAIAPGQPQTGENRNVVEQWLESLKEEEEPQPEEKDQGDDGEGDASRPDEGDQNQSENGAPSESGESTESDGGDQAEGQGDPQPGEDQPDDGGESVREPTDRDAARPESTLDTTGEDRDDVAAPPVQPGEPTEESIPEQPSGEANGDEPDGMPSPDEVEQSAEERGEREMDGDATGEPTEEEAETGDARPTASGVMSRDEAKQLLDAMLYNERKLPITPEAAGREGGRPRHPQRNW